MFDYKIKEMLFPIFILLTACSFAQEMSPKASSNAVSAASVEATPVLTTNSTASALASPVTTNNSEDTALSMKLAGEAVSEKLPQVSASILRTKLEQETDPQKRCKIALKLSEILLIEKKPKEALTLFESADLSSNNQPIDEKVAFWKGQALLALGKSSEASSILEAVLSSQKLPQEYVDAARIALARADRSLHDYENALKVLNEVPSNSKLSSIALEERCANLLALERHEEVEALLKNKTPEQFAVEPRLAYLFALAAWQRGDQAEAVKRFNKISTNDHWVPSAVVSGLAALDVSKPAKAQVLLEKYLQENPRSPRLAELMNELEQLYLLENNNDVTLFRKWSKDSTEPLRASYALLPYARTMERLGHRDKANELLTSFLNESPHHPLANEARLELAQNQLLQGDAVTALATAQDLPEATSGMRARLAFVRGLAASSLKKQDEAKEAFAQAGSLDQQLLEDALYNQNLINLLNTSTSEVKAKEVIASSDMSESNDRKDYLELLQVDHGDPSSGEIVIKKARDFLAMYPESTFRNQVRMKLGETLLANGNTRDALVELERVGRAESSSELGRQALLLAAQASARSMDPKSIDDALMILEQVAQSQNGGEDVWRARFEQAGLKNAQGAPLEALSIYDQILVSPEPTQELREASQMAKGDTLSSLKDDVSYQKAITVWRELADASGTPPHWRNQALCKIGLISEKMGNADGALAAYYEAIKAPRDQEPEQLWHDKAYFEAARLLEAKQEWGDASQLYQQVIAEGGPRANEAKARLSKLRLENFLWDN